MRRATRSFSMSATSRIRPKQREHVRTSMANVRFRSLLHSRRRARSGSSGPSITSLSVGTACFELRGPESRSVAPAVTGVGKVAAHSGAGAADDDRCWALTRSRLLADDTAEPECRISGSARCGDGDARGEARPGAVSVAQFLPMRVTTPVKPRICEKRLRENQGWRCGAAAYCDPCYTWKRTKRSEDG